MASPAQNFKGEYIYRLHDEKLIVIPSFKKKELASYPWEKRLIGSHPRITKEFFRCGGGASHPLLKIPREGKEALLLRDCSGEDRHGLPLKEGREFVYPCLIELLNYIQEKSGKRVIITSGHRCPQHNTYCDSSPKNYSSKHLLGAEVDFYLEGEEEHPERILSLLQQYYREKEPFRGNSSFEKFQRYEKEGLNVSTPPWFNQEIFIKFYKKEEGRNFDNAHFHPYIGIQVRYDRDTKEKVAFDDKQAQNFLRH